MDKRGAGGNIATGTRLVRKNGRIKFDGFWHSHPKLVPLVGDEVDVQAEDAFFNEKVAVFHRCKFLCYARNEYQRQSDILDISDAIV